MMLSKTVAYAVAVAAIGAGAVFAPAAQAAVGTAPVSANPAVVQIDQWPGCGSCEPDVI